MQAFHFRGDRRSPLSRWYVVVSLAHQLAMPVWRVLASPLQADSIMSLLTLILFPSW